MTLLTFRAVVLKVGEHENESRFGPTAACAAELDAIHIESMSSQRRQFQASREALGTSFGRRNYGSQSRHRTIQNSKSAAEPRNALPSKSLFALAFAAKQHLESQRGHWRGAQSCARVERESESFRARPRAPFELALSSFDGSSRSVQQLCELSLLRWRCHVLLRQ